MISNLKKILIILPFILSCIFLGSIPVFADENISVLAQGTPVKTGNTTIQNVSLDVKTKKDWKLMVFIPDNCLKNISKISSQIKSERLGLQDNETQDKFSFESGKSVLIMTGNDSEKFVKSYSLILQNSDADYPGTYRGNIQFILSTSSGISMDSYNFEFNQPLIQNISAMPNSVNINVSSEDSMKFGHIQESVNPAKIFITSNKKWKLVLQGENQDTSLKYGFKVLLGNYKDYSSVYTDLPSGSLVIAEGEPTVSSDGQNLEAKIIEMSYMLKTSDNNLLPAGSYPFNLKYILLPR